MQMLMIVDYNKNKRYMHFRFLNETKKKIVTHEDNKAKL